MISIPTANNSIEKPRTCSQAASLLFPQPAKLLPAFTEIETGSFSEPGHISIVDLNDDFWALTLENVVFVQGENQFRQYNAMTGLYAPVQESTLTNQIIANLNLCSLNFPPRLNFDSFLALKTRQRLKSVVERARDLLLVDDSFFKPKSPYHINCGNGVVNCLTREFIQFSPDHPITLKLPVKYDPAANPEMFLKLFLANILGPTDINLLQQFCSQLLIGVNHSQKIMVLTGDAGWGKSTLMKILGSLLGWERVGIIREQLYRDDQELGHYRGRHLLYAPDMNSRFLNRPAASLFKQLVGGDPVWADTKDGERITILGTFPIVLACNAKPEIELDQDADAWARRLVVLEFKKPGHEQHLGKLADLLMQEELSGVLNWLLDGFAKLHKAGLQLTMTAEQQARTEMLLISAESPSVFVRSRIKREKGGWLGLAELYPHYQTWCRTQSLRPFTAKEFMRVAKEEIGLEFGINQRHDLLGEDGKAKRGWSGLVVRENIEKLSVVSA